MPDHERLDEGINETDLDLIAALQWSPRAGVRDLAEVLGVSAATVSRRLNRLIDNGHLRVVAQINWSALDEVPPRYVWMSAEPKLVASLAAEVSQLEQTQYVAITTGPSDIFAIVQPRNRADGADLLIETLSGLDGLVSSRTDTVLKSHRTAAEWRLNRLSREQCDRLQGTRVSETVQSATLTEEAWRVARLVRRNGRIGATEVARALDLPQSTAYRVLLGLLDRGIVTPRVEIEPGLIGYPIDALINLTVQLGELTTIAGILSKHPSARSVATVAGTASLTYIGSFRSEQDVERLITDDLASLSGINHIEVSMVQRVLKRYWIRRDGVRLLDDALNFPSVNDAIADPRSVGNLD